MPNLSLKPLLFSQTVGKATLNKLHCFFNCHIAGNCHEQVEMIGHDHKVMQLKFSCRHVPTQYFDQKQSIPV